jgi:hypothetical protein
MTFGHNAWERRRDTVAGKLGLRQSSLGKGSIRRRTKRTDEGLCLLNLGGSKHRSFHPHHPF